MKRFQIFLAMAKYKSFPEDSGKDRAIEVDQYPELGKIKQPEELDIFEDTRSDFWVVPVSANKSDHSKRDVGAPPVLFEVRNTKIATSAHIIFRYDAFTKTVKEVKCAISGLDSVDCYLDVTSLQEIRRFMDMKEAEAAKFIKDHMKKPAPSSLAGQRLCQILDDIIRRFTK